MQNYPIGGIQSQTKLNKDSNMFVPTSKAVDIAIAAKIAEIVELTTLTTPLAPQYGGTGKINNSANIITLTGNFSLGLTLSENTAVTLPPSGTLLNENSDIDGGSF
jgi:hypothetical protein